MYGSVALGFCVCVTASIDVFDEVVVPFRAGEFRIAYINRYRGAALDGRS